MTVHRVPGARDRSLLATLSALGLLRTLGEQADAKVRSWFDGEVLCIDTTVDDLLHWLTHRYVPTPVLSPWNEGSGYGVKDKAPRQSLVTLLENPDPRFEVFREAHDVAQPLADRFRAEKWEKGRLVAELRSTCPDPMLPWLDAAVVVLQGDKLAFPPLLGSGGNDGRLDFSTNFHQRLLTLVGVAGAAAERSTAWAHSWLAESNDVALAQSAVGQFDPGSAGTPNSSPWGAAESIVNPWQFVMMIEGAIWFASAPARRLSNQAEYAQRAAMTFTTYGSSAGSATGSAVEESRGEVWVPWWGRALTFAAVGRLFAEGRAVWRGQTATSSSQMYLATGAQGITGGVDGFDRYAITRRNGLAFSAVLADSLPVESNPMLTLVEQTEDWPNRLSSFERSQAIELAWRRFDAARVALVRERTRRPDLRLRDYLSSITALELAVAHSGRARESLPPRTPTRRGAQTLLLLTESEMFRSLLTDPWFRLAAAFASIRTASASDGSGARSLRQILLPIDPPVAQAKPGTWRAEPVVSGIGTSPWIDVVADVGSWHALAVTQELPGARSGSVLSGLGHRGQLKGVTGPPHGVGAWAADLHRLVGATRSELAETEQWWLALLALDWTWAPGDIGWSAPRPSAVVPDPLLAGLLGLRHGVGSEQSERRAGWSVDQPSGDAEVDVARYGLRPEWFAQLRAGQCARVHVGVTARLRQVGRAMVEPIPESLDARRGRVLAAALLPRCRDWESAVDRVSRSLRTAVSEDQVDTSLSPSLAEETT